MTRFAPTALSAMHLAEGSDRYLAPELTALNADPVYLDVYGRVLTYLLVTGKAAAASEPVQQPLSADDDCRCRWPQAATWRELATDLILRLFGANWHLPLGI
jgi:hypothetical protein